MSRGPGAALPLDSSVFFKLVRVVNLTARPFVETLSHRHQLTLNEWRAMVVLANHPGVAASEVAHLTGLDKMSVSRAVAGLVRHGRLRKASDAADARRTLLRLSDEGLALFRTVGRQAGAREKQLFGGVSALELRQLDAIADRLLASLGSEAE
jgi:DNA-binding MarR family transcriptional regulator